MKNYLVPVLLGMVLYSCSPNNVKEDASLAKYFEENKVTGCFAIMDNGSGQFTVHNLARYRDSAYLPTSTFDIVSALVGLQTGVISKDSMVIKWDSTKRKPEWDRDLTMYDAFRVSSVPYFQEVTRRTGKDTLQQMLDSISYGSKKITNRVDSFWLDNTLKLTPDEQLGLVKRLYFDQLPFFPTYQETVKRAMLFESNTNYKLSYKTGEAINNGKNLGWMVGWIVENNHPYFFVLNIESPDASFDMASVRIRMLKDILKHLGYMEGRM